MKLSWEELDLTKRLTKVNTPASSPVNPYTVFLL